MKTISEAELAQARAYQRSKITPEMRAQLEALRNRPDSEIDLSDIPEINPEQWKNAVRGALYRPLKEQITVRVDADVLAWLRSQGAGYQSRMNGILREAMLKA
jgi:uncharacterized protein (DUF4415 family)